MKILKYAEYNIPAHLNIFVLYGQKMYSENSHISSISLQGYNAEQYFKIESQINNTVYNMLEYNFLII